MAAVSSGQVVKWLIWRKAAITVFPLREQKDTTMQRDADASMHLHVSGANVSLTSREPDLGLAVLLLVRR